MAVEQLKASLVTLMNVKSNSYLTFLRWLIPYLLYIFHIKCDLPLVFRKKKHKTINFTIKITKNDLDNKDLNIIQQEKQ